MEKKRYIRMDEVTRNMLIHALRDVFQEEKEQGRSFLVTGELILKIAGHTDKKLFLTEEEHKKAQQALNRLRDQYIANGRYADGIDTVYAKLMEAKYSRFAMR